MKAPTKFRLVDYDKARSVREYDPQHSRDYGARWRKIRLMQLRVEPLCRHCKANGVVTPATEVDHILRLKRGGTNEAHNLQSLCKPCHSRKTQLEEC